MRIPALHRRAASIAGPPMAALAVLLVMSFAMVAMFAAPKGLAIRFADRASEPLPSADRTGAVWVKVLSDGSLRVDGAPADLASLPASIRARIAAAPEITVVLFADPDATFQAMVSAYDALLESRAAGNPGPGRIAIPTGAQVAEYVRVYGRDPFEAKP